MRSYWIYLFALVVMTGCMPEDEAVVLPPAGDTVTMSVNMGSDYTHRIYLDLSSGQTQRELNNLYHLEFDSEGSMLYLSSGAMVRAWDSGETDPSEISQTTVVQEPEYNFAPDSPSLKPDSLVFKDWNVPVEGKSGKRVYVVQLGIRPNTGFPNNLFRKVVINSVDEEKWEIAIGRLNDDELTPFTIYKDKTRSKTYFSFDDDGKVVENVEPPKKDWDMVIMRYQFIYWSEPLDSPFRYYSVSGVLNNKNQGIKTLQLQKNHHPAYVPWDEMTLEKAKALTLTDKADEIGFEWKAYDFTFGYKAVEDNYYIVTDADGGYYKLRFLDFYSETGEKGTPLFQFKAL